MGIEVIRTSSEQAPVRTLTTTVSTPETQADSSAGGAEGGPVLRPAGSSLPRSSARPASSADAAQDLPSEPVHEEEKPSLLPWIVGGGAALIILGFVIRRGGW